MGCLRNLIRAVIITLAVVGFMSLGGKELVNGWFSQWFNPSQETIVERAKKVGDFSKINEEFELEKAAGVLGYNAVVAEHKASGQKLVVVDSSKKEILTQADIQSDDIENRLKATLQKVKYQAISVEEIKVTKRGTIYSYGQENPYVKFNAKISRLPIGDVSGIISVAKAKDGTNRVLVSVNEKSKYSQLISDEFFKNVR